MSPRMGICWNEMLIYLGQIDVERDLDVLKELLHQRF